MTLTNILAEAYRRLGFASSPASDVTTRLTGFANSEVKEVLSDPVLSKFRRRTIPFATVADLATAVLPQAVTRIYTITDRTNQRVLDDVDQAWIREQDPGRSFSSGTPEAYAIIGYSDPVARQPSDSSQLLVKSSAGGDTTQTAYIEVVDSDGYVRTASVTLTGATAVNLGPADSLTVIDFYLSATAVGEVTLHEDTGSGTELAKIGIGKTRARYTALEMYPTTSSAVTLHADADLEISDLVNGADEPIIPDEFSEIIILGVQQREYLKREKPDIAREYEKAKAPWRAKMHFHVHRKSSGSGSKGHSQLGGFYEAGT